MGGRGLGLKMFFLHLVSTHASREKRGGFVACPQSTFFSKATPPPLFLYKHVRSSTHCQFPKRRGRQEIPRHGSKGATAAEAVKKPSPLFNNEEEKEKE